jgi:hypothetical protein
MSPAEDPATPGGPQDERLAALLRLLLENPAGLSGAPGTRARVRLIRSLGKDNVVDDPTAPLLAHSEEHVAIRLWDRVLAEVGTVARGITTPRAVLSLLLGVLAECVVLAVADGSGWVAFATLLFVSVVLMNSMGRQNISYSSPPDNHEHTDPS